MHNECADFFESQGGGMNQDRPRNTQSVAAGSSFVSVESIWRDIRFAVRSLLKAPGFTVVAILVMAVGIGANTAVFSVINTVLLKPLTYPDPQSLRSEERRVGKESISRLILDDCTSAMCG